MRKIPIILVLCITFFAHTTRAADFVHISEIFYHTPLNEVITAPPFSNGEYIELFNAGQHPVNLEGWVVRGDGVTEIFTFGELILPPQSFLILAYRHNWTPDFQLSHLFTEMDYDAGQIVYQNRITLKNSSEYVRLYDSSGLLRDSIFYGNTTAVQPSSARLIATNANGAPWYQCVSVQRKIVEFDERGVAVANHLHWHVDSVRPFSHSRYYTLPNIPLPLVNEVAEFAYDAAGNRIARTIILKSSNAGNMSETMDVDEYDWWKDENPFTDFIDEFQVNIHPNPTHGRLIVEIDMEGREIESVHIMVVAPNGTLVLRKQTTSAIIPVDLFGAPIGNYTLHITINGHVQQYKIVKL